MPSTWSSSRHEQPHGYEHEIPPIWPRGKSEGRNPHQPGSEQARSTKEPEKINPMNQINLSTPAVIKGRANTKAELVSEEGK